MGHYLVARAKCLIESNIKNKKGQGMVEYALIIAFVVVIAAGLINSGDIKTKITKIFTNLSGSLDTASTN